MEIDYTKWGRFKTAWEMWEENRLSVGVNGVWAKGTVALDIDGVPTRVGEVKEDAHAWRVGKWGHGAALGFGYFLACGLSLSFMLAIDDDRGCRIAGGVFVGLGALGLTMMVGAHRYGTKLVWVRVDKLWQPPAPSRLIDEVPRPGEKGSIQAAF